MDSSTTGSMSTSTTACTSCTARDSDADAGGEANPAPAWPQPGSAGLIPCAGCAWCWPPTGVYRCLPARGMRVGSEWSWD